MFDDCHLRLGQAPFACTTPMTATLLASLYALPHHEERPLYPILAAAAHGQPWSTSLAVAPEATTVAVGAMLRAVMLATPDMEPGAIVADGLPVGSRARVHLEALRDLWRANPGVVPADLAAMKDFLGTSAADALQPMVVIRDRAAMHLTRLEAAVLDRLERHHGVPQPDDCDVQRLVIAPGLAQAGANSLLGHVQRNLLNGAATRVPADDSLAILSVRDSLTEAEAVAAIIQRWLREDPAPAPGEIAVILPDCGPRVGHLGDAFANAGLVPSGLPAVTARRNHGGETVLHFVQCRRRPAPAMALASLYCSPVLCWPTSFGHGLARAVMQGSYASDDVGALDERGTTLLRSIRAPAPRSNRQLGRELRHLRKLLTHDPALHDDCIEAIGAALRIEALLRAGLATAAPDWDAVIALAGAYKTPAALRGPAYLGGIAILLAHEAPVRAVRKLVIMGFNDGAWPGLPGGNPFFLDSEVAAIAEATGLTLPSRASALDAALHGLVRQIGAARDQAVLVFSDRNLAGNALAPSSSLPLIARLVDGVTKPDDLICALSSADATIWDRLIDWRPRQAFAPIVAPDILPHFDLGCDLLALRTKSDGSVAAQSPSRLEKLLVSPLAWVLGELNATHVSWQPERLGVMLRGSLAHEVFELLFKPGRNHPDDRAIEQAVPVLLDARIHAIAPFLESSAWAVERSAMAADITTAAKHWSLALTAMGAEIIGNEFWLSGTVFGHPVHGKADCLVRLPDGQLIVVDYKKSSSGTRRRRLNNGWDLQVELYRRMTVRIDERSGDDARRIAAALDAGNRAPGVAYHTLNDGRFLVNGIDWGDGIATEHIDVIDGDIAVRALDLVQSRMAALRAGQIATNSTADADFFSKKASLGAYALDESPLVTAFMRRHPDPSVGMEELGA